MPLFNNYRLPVEVLADIIRTQMNLSLEQVFTLQGFKQPTDKMLYISINEIDNKSIAPLRENIYTNGQLQEKLTIYMIGLFSINIYNDAEIDMMNDATFRKNEIHTALFSTYARQMMDLYHITLPVMIQSFKNTSEPAGSSIVNLVRWTATYQIGYSFTKIFNIDYFDNFTNTGLIEN